MLSSLASRCHRRRLVVVIGVSSLSLFRRCWQRLPSLCSSVGFYASLLLSPSSSRRCCRFWRLVVVGCVSLASEASLFYRCCRLLVVVFGVLLSLLSRSCWRRSPLLWLVPSSSVPRHRCRCRRLFVVVGVSLFLLSSASCLCQRQQHLVVVVIGGVTAFSEKLSLY